MDSLPPNATSEEIEDELLLQHVLLESLDAWDEDYERKKQDIERQSAELEARLERLRNPGGSHRTTPHQPNARTGQTFDLPSRESQRSQHLASPASPLAGRGQGRLPNGLSTDQDPVIAGPSLGSSTSSAQDSVNKRRRDSWSFATADNTSKRSRLRDGTPSTVSTPPTYDSLDEEDAAFEQRHGLNLTTAKDNIMKKMLEQQRQREMRIKREQEDAEFARLLEFQQRSETPSFQQQSTQQSTVDRNGQIHRPAPPAPPQAYARPSISSQPLMSAKREPGGQIMPGYTSANDSSDESLAEITPAQFIASHSPRSRSTVMPGTYPGAPAYGAPASNGYVANGYGPPGMANQSHNFSTPTTTLDRLAQATQNRFARASGPPPMLGGTSVYNANPMTAALSQALHARSSAGDAFRDRVNFLTQVANLAGSSIAGPSGGRSMGLPGGLYEGNFDSEDEEMHRGGRAINDWYDPEQAKEELEKLLENIRPDEEIPPELRDQPKELKCKLHEHQKLGLAWMKTQEEGSNKGGILADDMGLGKTIQALALIASRPSDDRARKTTLIIAPVALMKQWADEIKDQLHIQYRLRVHIFHGQQKNVTFATLSQYDVVITTFGKLASEYKVKANLELRRETDRNAGLRPSERLVLLSETAKWYRVIIDEAQCIKNKDTKGSLGAAHLNATYRFCMTGTPMMNSVMELYSLIRFLRIRPYNEFAKFNRDFKVLKNGGKWGRERAMQAFQALLKAILLRRTKKSKVDGKPILQLPERTAEIAHAVFDEDEEKFYRALETETRLEVNKYLQAGKVGRNYSYILVRLLRLRQACCHPHLIRDFAEDGPGEMPVEDMRELAKTLDQSVVARLKESQGNFECPICYDAAENPTIFFPCGHDVCTECFVRMTDPANAVANGEEGTVTAKCPECRAKVDPKKILNWTSFKKAHMPENEEDEDDGDLNVKTKVEDGSETESESDDEDDDSDDDADSQGDLRDFIVDDDDEVEYEKNSTDDEEEVKAERRVKPEPSSDDDDDDYDLDNVGPSKSRGKAVVKRRVKFDSKVASKLKGKGKATTKGTGKGKGKGKEKKKDKKKKTLADLKRESLKNVKAKHRYLRRLRRNWIPSAKINKVLEILRETRDREEGEKTLIFSQFTSLLDLLEVAIGEEFPRYRRYDGSMSSTQREDAVQDFKRKPDVTVMLVSLKAGNAGLNLTAASQVIMLDPFWNPFIEEQAIDRAHRLGQTRPVMVHRILVANTVEDRIIALQEKKRELINQALDEKAGQSVSRLGRAELAYLFNLNPTLPAPGT